MPMAELFSTKEVAKYIGVNEKMVYALVTDKGLPATKITGKWLFPRHLVDQWIENNIINYPKGEHPLPPYEGLLIIAGSNDPLLEHTISIFNRRHTEHMAVFGNMGSLGGLQALRKNLCHIASSHLLQDNEQEYNFAFAHQELETMPAVVNFCRREQGLLVRKGNPKNIKTIIDLAQKGIRIVNRPLSTGTRLLFDRELKKAGISGEKIEGYQQESDRHLDAGLEVLSGRADVAPAIRPVATMLGLDFIPIRWERYDLLVTKERFFDQGVQLFLEMLRDPEFLKTAGTLTGYDMSICGQMIFPQQIKYEK